MDAFSAYSIPIQGLKVGVHRFSFPLDKEFFQLFEDAPIKEANLEYQVVLDKRHDMLLFEFEMEGRISSLCDRCTAQIWLPIETSKDLVVKYGEQEGEAEDEVVFIHRESPKFNLAPYLYEFSILALPITNVYDCESEAEPPCNKEVLKLLEKSDQKDEQGSVWDALKDLNKN